MSEEIKYRIQFRNIKDQIINSDIEYMEQLPDVLIVVSTLLHDAVTTTFLKDSHDYVDYTLYKESHSYAIIKHPDPQSMYRFPWRTMKLSVEADLGKNWDSFSGKFN